MGSFTIDILEMQNPERKPEEKEEAFERILDRFWARVPHIRLPDNLQRVVDDEDIRQEVSVVMWVALTTAPDGKGIWMALGTAGRDRISEVFCRFFGRVVKNRCASRTRTVIREARHVRGGSALLTSGGAAKEVTEAFAEVQSHELPPDLAALAGERKVEFATAFLSLPEDQQNVMIALYVLDCTIEETASCLGLTFAQVRYKEKKGLEALRVALADEAI
jgi:RNA polymerase sigma factor (sigma-70 family)